MLQLLKEKSKVQWEIKARKKYEALKPGLKVQKEDGQNDMIVDQSAGQVAKDLGSSLAAAAKKLSQGNLNQQNK